ncbi:MAG: SCP2 sterol-binding domain-containing protein [Deltaproteobacteria bacterium]|nr:SCP2 sterol-binding domain-containing protein [Deltaproteobacteria bacterium]
MAETFLSDGWFSQTEKIQNEVNPPVPPAIKDLKINMQVTGGPSGEVAFRMEAGRLVKGHAADAPTKLVIPFDTARAMLIDQNQQAVMSAFMSGQIRVEGDMAKLMQMQMAGPPSPEAQKVSQLIKEMTTA